jgi:hypothetical protein
MTEGFEGGSGKRLRAYGARLKAKKSSKLKAEREKLKIT